MSAMIGMTRAWTIAAILAAGLLGAPAPVGTAAALQSRPARDCFSAGSVNGFRPVGSRYEAVDVTVSRTRQYRLTLAGYCPDIGGALSVALRSRAGSSFICAGLDADILVRGPAGPQRCAVTEVRRLSPEEIEAARRR